MVFCVFLQDAALQDLFALKQYGDNMRRLLHEMECEKSTKVIFEENRAYVMTTPKPSMFKMIKVQCQTLANFVYTFPGRALAPLLGFGGATDFRQRPAIQMAEDGRGDYGKRGDYRREALEDGLYSSGNGHMSVRERGNRYGHRVNQWNSRRL